MPYENYGKSGLSNKPNTNAEGMVDEAADPVNPHELAAENAATSRAAAAPDNDRATQRPQETPDDQND